MTLGHNELTVVPLSRRLELVTFPNQDQMTVLRSAYDPQVFITLVLPEEGHTLIRELTRLLGGNKETPHE